MSHFPDEAPEADASQEDAANPDNLEQAETSLPVSEVARRLSLLGRLIVPPSAP